MNDEFRLNGSGVSVGWQAVGTIDTMHAGPRQSREGVRLGVIGGDAPRFQPIPEKLINAVTSDAIPQIALGESEVRRAQALAADEEYLIAFVTNALDPARRRLYILQNPLAAGGFEFYRVAGRSMRLQFRLPAS